jgi:hypothetical protein
MEIAGLYGTANHAELDRVKLTLAMIGNPDLGVSIQYSKWDGRVRKRLD